MSAVLIDLRESVLSDVVERGSQRLSLGGHERHPRDRD